MDYIIEMLNITKTFPGIVANDNVNLLIKKGEIHALLGENGAGKSTLMSILFGMYQPDKGEIRLDDTPRNVFKNVDLLKAIGLDVPQVTLLAYELRKAGLEIRDDVLSVDECTEEIFKLCQ